MFFWTPTLDIGFLAGQVLSPSKDIDQAGL